MAARRPCALPALREARMVKGSEDERQELPLFAVILGAYLLISLNRFVSDHNASSAPDQRYEQFTSNDRSGSGNLNRGISGIAA